MSNSIHLRCATMVCPTKGMSLKNIGKLEEAATTDSSEINSSAKGFWERVETPAKVVSMVALPIVIAIGGWFIQKSVMQQSVSKDYVALAISILERPLTDTEPSLRVWAVDLLNSYTPLKFPSDLVARLKTGSLDLSNIGALSNRSSGGLAISSDNNYAAVGWDDGTITITDTQSGLLSSIIHASKDAITSVAFSPDGSLLYSSSNDGTISVWRPVHLKNFRMGAELVRTIVLSSAALGIAVSSDGHTLIVRQVNNIMSYDTSTWKATYSFFIVKHNKPPPAKSSDPSE